MGRFQIFACLTADGKIRCYEDSVCVASVPIDALDSHTALCNNWRVEKIDSNRFRVTRTFLSLGNHSIILTKGNYLEVPFTLYLLPLLVFWICILLCCVWIYWMSYHLGNRDVLYVLTDLAVTTCCVIPAIWSLFQIFTIQRRRKAIVSLFTIPEQEGLLNTFGLIFYLFFEALLSL